MFLNSVPQLGLGGQWTTHSSLPPTCSSPGPPLSSSLQDSPTTSLKSHSSSLASLSFYTVDRTTLWKCESWRQPKCPSIDEWIKKLWYTHTHTHTHTRARAPAHNGILLSHKKEWNHAIDSHMDEPRLCHVKWNKPDRERQIAYDVAYMWSLKNWYKWIYFQNRNRLIDRKQIYGSQRKDGNDILEVWDKHIHTTISKTDKQEGHTI